MRREALAVLSSGTLLPHREVSNLEYLDPTGVDLLRANDGEVPLLSAHDPEEPIGFIRRAWRSTRVLKARLRFDNTPEGRAAFDRLENGEVCGVSIGSHYDSNDIKVIDARGCEYPFDEYEWRTYWQDPAAILHVKRWQLIEVSMTPRPLDRGAVARAVNHEARRVRRRMEVAQRQALDHVDRDPILTRMLGSRLVHYGRPAEFL